MSDEAGADGAKTLDGYIPVRTAVLAEAIIAENGPSEADAQAWADLVRLLSALMRHAGQERLELMHAYYEPLDPDAAPPRRDLSPAAFERFEKALSAELQRGNFTEVDPESVRTAKATKRLTGLAIKPSQDGIRRIRYFARGSRTETFTFKTWFGLRTHEISAETLRDVVVCVGFKADQEIEKADRRAFARMRRGVRPGAVLVKHFRNVAAPELVTLHPGARPTMRRRDQAFLAAPAIIAGAPVLINLWPALTVLGAVLAAYFGAQGVIQESELKRAVAAISGLVAVVAFVMRQRLKYEAQTLRYQKRLADTVYFRNLANNAGVIDLLAGAAAEQDVKEALLAYCVLRKANRPLTREEIDAAAEGVLRARFGLNVDFEVRDALDKLQALGLLAHAGETYAAIPPAEALARLDQAWDDLFHFRGRA
ncbi:MAG TPA: DUF3754 domain-containing protein [Terricaulis sp.]|nr:DUF3754 domain-containing protein [Terricaulis sp.]